MARGGSWGRWHRASVAALLLLPIGVLSRETTLTLLRCRVDGTVRYSCACTATHVDTSSPELDAVCCDAERQVLLAPSAEPSRSDPSPGPAAAYTDVAPSPRSPASSTTTPVARMARAGPLVLPLSTPLRL